MSVRERRVARGVFERFFNGGSVYVLRFTCEGERHYVTLGSRADGWSDRRAVEEYANVMADVRRRIWLPPKRTKSKRGRQDEEEGTIPTFETFAAGYLDGRVGEVSERSVAFERWAVDLHLRPFFGNYMLDEIDTQLVDDYRRHKVSQSRARSAAIEAGRPLTARIGRRKYVLRPFGATTINKTIEILQTILTQAVEYKLIPENPAEGRRRRLAVPPKQAAHLESVDEIEALLEAAAGLDRQRRYRMTGRLPSIATLIFAGLRAHELCLLRWRNVDLANRKLRITRSKTKAGIRIIDIVPILHAALSDYKAGCDYTDPDDYVFPTGTGGIRDKDNVRNRVVEPVLKAADELLISRGRSPLPEGLSPHKLRHAFASILAALGTDPVTSKRQIGHTRYEFTLEVYTHDMASDLTQRARLRELVNSTPPNTRTDDEPPDTLAA